MLKKIVPSLLIAGAAITSASAAEGAAAPIVGFEFGVNYILPFDDRYEGASTTFAIVFPLGASSSLSVYHENLRLSGDDEGSDDDVDGSINQLRFQTLIWSGDKQDIGLVVGVGHGSYEFDFDGDEVSGIVGDVAAQFTVIKAKNGPVLGEANLNVGARFSPFANDIDFNTDEVTDMNSLILGLSAGVFF